MCKINKETMKELQRKYDVLRSQLNEAIAEAFANGKTFPRHLKMVHGCNDVYGYRFDEDVQFAMRYGEPEYDPNMGELTAINQDCFYIAIFDYWDHKAPLDDDRADYYDLWEDNNFFLEELFEIAKQMGIEPHQYFEKINILKSEIYQAFVDNFNTGYNYAVTLTQWENEHDRYCGTSLNGEETFRFNIIDADIPNKIEFETLDNGKVVFTDNTDTIYIEEAMYALQHNRMILKYKLRKFTFNSRQFTFKQKL